MSLKNTRGTVKSGSPRLTLLTIKLEEQGTGPSLANRVNRMQQERIFGSGADPGTSGGGDEIDQKTGQGSGGRHRPPAGSRGRAPGGGQRDEAPHEGNAFSRILQ
jgi:hypothetical protein